MSMNRSGIIDTFHKLYYEDEGQNTWKRTYWKNVSVQKCPLDLWIYQEIIARVKPYVIIETGTLYGGSALFLADMLDLCVGDDSKIITIDIEGRIERPQHPRIRYVTASSTSKVATDIVDVIINIDRTYMGDNMPVLVILDSDHSEQHVTNEMNIYHKYVTPGSYLIVEDSNINGYPVFSSFGPGPMEAIDLFLSDPSHEDFIIDTKAEKFMLTFNPRGYLLKIK